MSFLIHQRNHGCTIMLLTQPIMIANLLLLINLLRIWGGKMYTHMTAVSKYVYVDKPGGYIDFHVESNEKDPKLKVNDHVRISKY